MQSDTPDDDNELWSIMMEDVTPLSEKSNKIIKKTPKKILQPKNSSKNNTNTSSVSTPSYAKDIDKRTQQKLKKGQLSIEARLDLHGMTQQQAHSQLIPFIINAYENNKRPVIVITGKGKGILQSKVPQWLETSPIENMILKTAQAQPKDGGCGALYVYIRRKKINNNPDNR